MMEKIYLISDIEMGRGDLMDDFSDDEKVAIFFDHIHAKNPDQKVTLVLNGDIFDFLKMSYKDEYPRYITEQISLWKLQQVLKSHPKVFEKLKLFLQSKNHSVHFVIGNHDADLVWPSLQQKIRDILEAPDQIFFDFWFLKNQIYAEHGHLLDPFYSIKTKKPVISYRGQKILNLPWGAQAFFSHLINLKKNFPKEEQLYPKHIAFRQNKKLHSYSKKIRRNLALKNILLQPLLHFYDPTYRVPYVKFIKHIYRNGFEVLNDAKLVQKTFKILIRKNPGKQIFILSHYHVLGSHQYQNKTIFVTDTWRNEFDVTKNKEKKQKSYVEIDYINGIIEKAELKVFQ